MQSASPPTRSKKLVDLCSEPTLANLKKLLGLIDKIDLATAIEMCKKLFSHSDESSFAVIIEVYERSASVREDIYTTKLLPSIGEQIAFISKIAEVYIEESKFQPAIRTIDLLFRHIDKNALSPQIEANLKFIRARAKKALLENRHTPLADRISLAEEVLKDLNDSNDDLKKEVAEKLRTLLSQSADELAKKAFTSSKNGNNPAVVRNYTLAIETCGQALSVPGEEINKYSVLIQMGKFHVKLAAHLTSCKSVDVNVIEYNYGEAIDLFRRLPVSIESCLLLGNASHHYATFMHSLINDTSSTHIINQDTYSQIIKLYLDAVNYYSQTPGYKTNECARRQAALSLYKLSTFFESLYEKTHNPDYRSRMIEYLRRTQDVYDSIKELSTADIDTMLKIQRMSQKRVFSSPPNPPARDEPRTKRKESATTETSKEPSPRAKDIEAVEPEEPISTAKKPRDAAPPPATAGIKRSPGRSNLHFELSPDTLKKRQREREYALAQMCDLIEKIVYVLNMPDLKNRANVVSDSLACYMLFLSQCMRRYFQFDNQCNETVYLDRSSRQLEKLMVMTPLPENNVEYIKAIARFAREVSNNHNAAEVFQAADITPQLKKTLSKLIDDIINSIPAAEQNQDTASHLQQIGACLKSLLQYASSATSGELEAHAMANKIRVISNLILKLPRVVRDNVNNLLGRCGLSDEFINLCLDFTNHLDINDEESILRHSMRSGKVLEFILRESANLANFAEQLIQNTGLLLTSPGIVRARFYQGTEPGNDIDTLSATLAEMKLQS